MEDYSNPKIRMLKKYSLLFAVALLVIVCVVLITQKLKTNKAPSVNIEKVSLLPGNPVAGTIYAAQDYSIFSNGRHLVKYSLKSGETTQLTSTNTMPVLSSLVVSPDERLIAFQSLGLNSEIPAFAAALKGNDVGDTSTWWLVDTKTKELTFLSQDAEQLQWENGNSLLFASGRDINKFNIAAKKSQVVFSHDLPIVSFRAFGNTVYISDSGTVSLVDLGQKNAQEVYSPATNAVFGEKKGCFLAQNTEDFTDETTSTVVGCGSENVKIGEEEEGQNATAATFTKDGKSLVYYQDTDINYVDLASGNIGSIEIDDASNYGLLGALDLNTLFLQQENSRFSITGRETSYKEIAATASLSLPNIAIDFFADKQSIVVSKYSAFNKAERLEVLSRIQKAGYDPSLYYIDFQELTPDSYRW